MGVVNVTPDSFSDGGRWFDTTTAVKHGLDLVAQGADLVDVGGESTRPGATRVDEAEELKRVIPVVRGLAAEGVTVSVDTMRASVAEQSLAAGAALVNDVSGGLADPAMIGVVAAAGAPFVVMHWRGFLEGGNVRGEYDDVVTEVADELHARVEAVLEGGIAADRVIVDPGLGFSKDAGHDLALLARLDRLLGLGHPLLVAASRKRFLGRVLAGPDAPPPPARERDAATAAVSALSAQAGAWAVRVHEVRASADAVRVVRAIQEARQDDAPTSPSTVRKEPGDRTPHRRRAGRGRQHRLLRGTGEGRLRGGRVGLAHPRRPRRRRGVPRPRRHGRRLLRAPRLAGAHRTRRGAPLVRADHGEHRLHPVLPHRRARLRHRGHRRGDLHGEHPQRRSRPEEGEELGPLVGQLVVATNVYRRTPSGWKLWSHHASPVLAEEDDDEDDDTPTPP